MKNCYTSRGRGRAEIAAPALGAGAPHPEVVKVIQEWLAFLFPLHEKGQFEVPFCWGFCADSRAGKVRAPDQSGMTVHYEHLGVHSDAVEKLNPGTEPALRVELFVPAPERGGGKLRVDYSERDAAPYKHCHQIHERHESTLVEKSRSLYVRRGNPHETGGAHQVRSRETVVNLFIQQQFHVSE
jgi:hypothetical protein